MCYHTNYPDDSVHGDSAVILKNSLIYHPIPITPTDYIKTTAISILTKPNVLTSADVYCSRTKKISPHPYLTLFHSLGFNSIAGGDLIMQNIRNGVVVLRPLVTKLSLTASL